MKNIFVIIALAFFANTSFGAIVKSATIDSSQENLVLEVVYGGGCAEHDFTLSIGMCLETFPVSCEAQLIDNTFDSCEALVAKTVVLPLAQLGLKDSYYSGAHLTITGDMDWQTKKASEATVRLPK